MSKFGIIQLNNVFLLSMKKNDNHWLSISIAITHVYMLVVKFLMKNKKPVTFVFDMSVGSDCITNCYDFVTKKLIQQSKAS